MSQAKVLWNNGASWHLGEILGHEYVDETYKTLSDALVYFQRVREAEEDKRIAAARVKLSDWKGFAAIYLAAHLAWCDDAKDTPEHDLNSALGYVQSNPAAIVDVLIMAVNTLPKVTEEDTGEAVA